MAGTETETPTLERLIKAAIENRLLDVYTALPGRVEAYTASLQKADIQPLIQRETVDAEIVDLPKLVDVPVKWPRTSTAIISLPLTVGDTGTIIFHGRSIDNWLISGGLVNPDDIRKHDLSDAEFIPGMYPFSQPGLAEDDNILIQNGIGLIRIKPEGKFEIGNGTIELIDEVIKELDEAKKTADASALITVNTVVGTSTVPNNVASFTAISAALVTIKAALETIKG